MVEKRDVLPGRDVLRDEVVFFYKLEQQSKEAFYRRIEFYDEENDRMLVFVTNHLELAAATIAAIYKERWQVELFFRALKQSLRVKTFVGTSSNALKTQLWTALIAMYGSLVDSPNGDLHGCVSLTSPGLCFLGAGI